MKSLKRKLDNIIEFPDNFERDEKKKKTQDSPDPNKSEDVQIKAGNDEQMNSKTEKIRACYFYRR